MTQQTNKKTGGGGGGGGSGRRGSTQIGRLGLECEIVRHEIVRQQYVRYTIHLRCQANDETWRMDKRYSDFYKLNTELQSDPDFRGIRLPELPPKAVSLSDSKKKELVQQRMQQLQDYLTKLITRTVFLASASVRAFLEMPASVQALAIELVQRQNAALKQGWMMKKGAVNKKWRKRWFVMQPNHILKYYKEESSTKPQGSIDLSSILHVGSKEGLEQKKNSFVIKTRDRVWWLACDDEHDKREWVRVFMRLKDTKAPLRPRAEEDGGVGQSLNLGAHFKSVTKVAWSPTIPGIVATGSKDESVKVWVTQLIDNTLTTDKLSSEEKDSTSGTTTTTTTNTDTNTNTSTGLTTTTTTNNWRSAPLHAIEFAPIAEFKTSGEVTALEWSPDSTMITVSVRRSNNPNETNKDNEPTTEPKKDKDKDGDESRTGYQYYLQCFDLSPVIGGYTPDDDDSGSIEDGSNNHEEEIEEDAIAERTKIFTLQDHPARLCFSNDGNQIYMGMDIDPNSEENEKRRPAFLVYLNLAENQLHRCRTVDRIIDHQTEFIVDLSLNHDRSLLVVATGTHQGNGRLIGWDLDSDETRIIEKSCISPISSMKWAEDDSWLVIGRKNGYIEFWHVEHRKKTHKPINSIMQSPRGEESSNNITTGKNKGSSDKESDHMDTPEPINTKNEDIDASVEVEREPQVSNFEQKWVLSNAHNGKIFNLTMSNGLLISSAELGNMEYESFFAHHILWDIRALINNGQEPRMIAALGNIHGAEKDITRLLELSPVTTRHVREGGGPGTLLAATGHCNLFCHNIVDVLLDALHNTSTEEHLQK